MPLNRDDIIGTRIDRVMQTYELLDGWIDFIDTFFVLGSGVSFRLPSGPESGFEHVQVPPSASPMEHPLFLDVKRSRIAEVYRPRNVDEWYPDSVWVQMQSGLWVGQESSAPHGTGGAGVYILTQRPADLESYVPFWKTWGPP